MRSPRAAIASRLLGAFFVFAALCPPAWAQADGRFAAEIAALAQDDRGVAEHCPIVFVGSSSIRLWRGLNDDMAPAATLNRGFGGARIGDVNANFEALVARPRPWAIFFYAGENDLAEGATPAQVVAEFAAFLHLKVASLGATPVYFISLKPSPARFGQIAAQRQVNRAVRRMAGARRDLSFVDVASAMLDRGRPREIFIADGLHMSASGYEIWTEILRPLVLRETARSRPRCNAAPGSAP